MGQKVRPFGFRVGITEDWRSRWYADKKHYGPMLVEDQRIRKHIKANYKFAGIPKIEIERARDDVKVILHTARPGVIIGRKGAEVDRLREQLQLLTGREVKIDIKEVQRPEVDAQLVAESIAEQLEKRAAFRRVIKRVLEATMDNGALGIKVELAGRLGGAEMARREKQSMGRVPLQTLRTWIDYGFTEAKTGYGHIGVKVWINRGEYGQQVEEDEAPAPRRTRAPARREAPAPAPAESDAPKAGDTGEGEQAAAEKAGD